MEITTYSLLIWLTAIIIGSLSLVIYLGSKRLSSRAFAFAIFWVMAWSFVVGLIPTANTIELGSFYLKLSFLLGEIIAACFFYLCTTFPEDTRPKTSTIITLFVLQIFFIFGILQTNLIISDASAITTALKWGQSYGPLWFLFDLAFFGFSMGGAALLYRKMKLTKETLSKTHLKYMVITILVGFIPPGLTTIILPRIGHYDLAWWGPITGLIWASVVAYSILKYRQMNVKVVTAEVLTISMGILTFVNIFTDFSLGIYGRVGSFVIFVFLGYFLIRNILKVSGQREELNTLNAELKDLNVNLQKKVEAQTKEVKKAYEIEKRANTELQKLDQNKNDFIIITQHHLRMPLNQIRWYANSMLSGLYGNLPAELADVVSRVDNACGKLTKTLNNFLEIVQLKIETKVLDLQPINVKQILKSLIHESSSEIRKAKLSITIPQNNEDWPIIQADEERLKDAFSVLIDNAIRYNKEKGQIIISIDKNEEFFIIHIANTTIELTENERMSLFTQSFFRSKTAKAVNPLGMGVGLLVAKTIIVGHDGSITLEKTPGDWISFKITFPLSK